jgi:hypothetical protein
MLLYVRAVHFDDSHGMRIELEESGSKRCDADDFDLVRLSRLEFKGY